jgi:hypothetical protein
MSDKLENGKINDDFDFWVDATSFVKTLLPEDVEERIVAHMKERGFNQNEMRLSREFMVKAFDLYPMMAFLKHLCDKQSEADNNGKEV